jgi:hypothetical protein
MNALKTVYRFNFIQQLTTTFMSNTKKCPHCGNTFEGRANKIYCSNKCKMAAFQQDKAQDAPPKVEVSEPLLMGNPLPHFRPKDKPQTENKEQILKLEIELRRLELAHQKEIALLQAQDRERERNFELKKMQLTFEQEKKELQNEIASLQKQNMFVLQQNNEPNKPEDKAVETEDYYEMESEEEYEVENEDEYGEDEQEEESEEIVLPLELRKMYVKLIRTYLAWHKTSISKERAQKALKYVEKLQSDFENFANEHDVSPDDWWEYRILLGIHQNLKHVFTTLKNRFFFQSQNYDFKFDDNWYRTLKESIKD